MSMNRLSFCVFLVSLGTACWAKELRPKTHDAPSFSFRKTMSAPAEFDDNFTYAVIAVSADQRSMIARNYIRVGSSEKIRWLWEHPERRGNRLFGLDPATPSRTRLPDSTTFGFIPGSTMVYLLTCDGTVRLWDTKTHKSLDVEFPHELATECAGPGPAISPDGKVMVTQTTDTLQFWDLVTLDVTTTQAEHVWSRDLAFSSDGNWLFTRGHRQMRIRSATTGQLVAGPFRHDPIECGIAYAADTSRLVTIENRGRQAEDDWISTAVIRSGQGWSDTKRIELSGHTREARWIGQEHLLVVSDVKRPGQTPPYTYERNSVSLVTPSDNESAVQSIAQHEWIRDIAVSPDAQHFLVTAGDWTGCWKVGESDPLWMKHEYCNVSLGDGAWVLLHIRDSAIVCSLGSGKEIRRWDGVVASRRDGATVWLCGAEGVEVWQAETE